ncbi:MAG: DNA repair protein RecO [Crocinitomix sp.]|nr:DNA repair protein RecO [Crocinitomix sp.]
MATGKTKGIVLRKVDYSETSIILSVLSPNDGVKSFIYKGAKRKKKKGNLITSLAQISIEYYQRNDSDLAKISNVEPTIIYKSIPFDPYKSSIVFFMNEVLNNTLRDNEKNSELYGFLENILQVLDLSDHVANYPIKFLYRLTQYLGFYPYEVESPVYLDLRECSYTKYEPNHGAYLSKRNSLLLLQFSGMKFDGDNDPDIDLKTRRELVYDLLKYYHVIFENFKPIQSLAVLEATFHD